jgi:hypothetical protein
VEALKRKSRLLLLAVMITASAAAQDAPSAPLMRCLSNSQDLRMTWAAIVSSSLPADELTERWRRYVAAEFQANTAQCSPISAEKAQTLAAEAAAQGWPLRLVSWTPSGEIAGTPAAAAAPAPVSNAASATPATPARVRNATRTAPTGEVALSAAAKPVVAAAPDQTAARAAVYADQMAAIQQAQQQEAARKAAAQQLFMQYEQDMKKAAEEQARYEQKLAEARKDQEEYERKLQEYKAGVAKKKQ